MRNVHSDHVAPIKSMSIWRVKQGGQGAARWGDKDVWDTPL